MKKELTTTAAALALFVLLGKWALTCPLTDKETETITGVVLFLCAVGILAAIAHTVKIILSHF